MFTKRGERRDGLAKRGSRPSGGTTTAARADAGHDSTTAWTPRHILVAAAIIAAVVLAVWLRFYRIAEPIAGFHAFNEGFYTRLSALESQRGLLSLLTNPIDLNNPPLYTAVVALAFRLLSPGVAVARAVSVLASLATAVVVYLLGQELWGRRAGITAGLVFLLLPGVVLVGRTAQTDALMVALGTGAVLAWVRGSRKGSGPGWSVAAGALLGAALLTKLPAVVVVPGMVAWEIARYRSFGWLRSRRFLIAVGAAAIVAGPWYLMRVASSGAAFFAAQSSVASSAGDLATAGDLRVTLAVEPFWMLTAGGLLALVLGLVVMARKRSLGDILVATELVSAFAFVAVFHYHTYYLLILTPWVALAAGRGLAAIAETHEATSTALTAVLLVTLGFSAVLMLQGVKWGQWSPKRLEPVFANPDEGVVLQVDKALYDNTYGPAIQFYLPREAIREGDPIPAGAKVLATLRIDRQRTGGPMFTMHSIRPVLFGYQVWQTPPLLNYFANGSWHAQRVGPLWWFGMTDTEVPLPYVLVDDSAQLAR